MTETHKKHKCAFPCDCPNPNDCGHYDDEKNRGAPAVVFFDKTWMCEKHVAYVKMCMERTTGVGPATRAWYGG
jgi:hypothetical protein